MDMPTIIIIAVFVAAGIYFVISKRKRKDKPTSHQPPTRPPVDVPTTPEPTTPDEPPAEPEPPADVPTDPAPDVLLDRHGNAPGAPGYDPRVDRPADQSSPVEHHGAYYDEGEFDPVGRWVGPDGVHQAK